MATKFKIHPAIGIARVGDSTTDFYLAPEGTGALPIACDQNGNAILQDGKEQPVSQFKDSQQRVMRQGARFRVYIYDDETPAGREIKIGDQITVVNPKTGQTLGGEVTDIQWTVYLANKKASWYEFQQLDGEHGYDSAHPLRNADITDANARQQLIIDPGPQTSPYCGFPKAIAERGTVRARARIQATRNRSRRRSSRSRSPRSASCKATAAERLRPAGRAGRLRLFGFDAAGVRRAAHFEPTPTTTAGSTTFRTARSAPRSNYKFCHHQRRARHRRRRPRPKPQYSTIAVDVLSLGDRRLSALRAADRGHHHDGRSGL